MIGVLIVMVCFLFIFVFLSVICKFILCFEVMMYFFYLFVNVEIEMKFGLIICLIDFVWNLVNNWFVFFCKIIFILLFKWLFR